MKKDAERMDPTVSAANATTVTVSTSVAEAPKKRTRGPNKPKPAVVADAAQ